ncbi:MAG TPA: type II toxin-antitoxin system VapC family toxin [Thermoanaerobaculia bacterium]|nr:type II toxin-antitoxin system VapC family toxin [Thermoanaerobaculia bacterium]
MRFWDTSALVPLFIQQPQTSLATEALADDHETVLWWATAVEYESALQRLLRQAVLDAEGVAVARESFSLLRDGAVEVEPSEELRSRAIRLLGKHPLRGADALQLASALTWVGDGDSSVGFVSFDDRLRAAAEREGLTVLPPSI